ncbi:glycosyltransferase family 4 protein [Streptomyces indicus]|uniref:D-inositol 3-phosphate glycosyltransferase n=1 Tax=Streptomyces indicus TaxID=417292 RepID=A0A1G9CHL9_9ACTN|nr:glycosyltransferase family 4 protein [Streptomyces indicus]SDK51157.1 Glycosyltransferase involved in cell wall bisynthesis [Streptomyces indicus]
MRIGLTGPVDLDPLREALGCEVPQVYSGPSTGWLARTWWEQGHDVTVVALSDRVRAQQTYGSGSLKLVVVPMRERHRARDLFREERRGLADALRGQPLDVVSAHWTYEFALGAIASGLPTCVTARDTPLRYAWEMRSAYRWWRHTMAVPAALKATALGANSPYTAAHFRRFLGVRRPIEVIPNAVRTDALPAPAAPPPGRAPVFATASQGWGRWKNTAAALWAFPLVRERLPQARLVMFGRAHGPGGEAETWARRRGLADGVEFAGPLPHAAMLRRLAAEAHVLVHPSRVESFSMICAEAMALGIPVVAGRRSGAVPWVVDRAGHLVDVDRPDLIAEAMLRLALDHAHRAELGALGRDRVRTRFSLDDTARAYTAWFARTVNCRGRIEEASV